MLMMLFLFEFHDNNTHKTVVTLNNLSVANLKYAGIPVCRISIIQTRGHYQRLGQDFLQRAAFWADNVADKKNK